jgi:hypothetical protein
MKCASLTFANFGLLMEGIPSLGGPPDRILFLGIECFEMSKPLYLSKNPIGLTESVVFPAITGCKKREKSKMVIKIKGLNIAPECLMIM